MSDSRSSDFPRLSYDPKDFPFSRLNQEPSLDYSADDFLEKLQAYHEDRMKPLRLIANLWTAVIVFGCLAVPGVLLWALWELLRKGAL